MVDTLAGIVWLLVVFIGAMLFFVAVMAVAYVLLQAWVALCVWTEEEEG